MTDQVVFWLLIAKGIACWTSAVVVVFAIATVFQKADWILKSALAGEVVTLSIMGALLLSQGILQTHYPVISIVASILFVVISASLPLWFMVAYFRFGRFAQIEDLVLRPTDVSIVFRGIWHNVRKPSMYDPSWIPSVESESNQKMQVH